MCFIAKIQSNLHTCQPTPDFFRFDVFKDQFVINKSPLVLSAERSRGFHEPVLWLFHDH